MSKFSEQWHKARISGQKEFTYNNKQYNTMAKGENTQQWLDALHKFRQRARIEAANVGLSELTTRANTSEQDKRIAEKNKTSEQDIGFWDTIGGYARDLASQVIGSKYAWFLGDVLGIDAPITNKSVSPQLAKELKQLAHELGPGEHRISSYTNTYGAVPTANRGFDNMKYPEVAGALGRFYMKVKSDGSIDVQDEYDFNPVTAEQAQKYGIVPQETIDALKNVGLATKIALALQGADSQNSFYNKVRWGVAPVFGSQPGEGESVNINLRP